VTEMEKALAAVVDAGVNEQREPVPFASKRPQTLGDQVQQLERIQREVVNRLRREGIEIQAAAERRITEAHARFARSLSEETARLERERDEEIRQATDEYHVRLHELSGLLRRRT
jgi:hypothetical protein